MKKIVSILACALLIVFMVTAFAACDPKGKETDKLVVYNWADYIFDDDLKDFKKYYQDLTGREIEITYVTFDTNETMLTRLTQGDSNVDVVCPSEYAIQKLWESNMLVPLNYFDESKYALDFNEKVKGGYEHNAANVEPQILEKVEETFGEMVNYFVPYMYGTLGILYNKEAFVEMGIYDPETMNQANWGILFNDNGNGGELSPRLRGNILMKDSIRDSYAATIFYLNESGKLNGLYDENGKAYTEYTASELINAVDDQLLEIIGETLTEQKKQLFGYEVDFGKDDLLQGNAIVDLAWSGDALYAVEESDGELAYYVPHGAGNIWFDGWVIPTTCNPDHLSAAKIFINYLNTPEVAAQNLLAIGYTPAVRPDVLQESDEAMKILMKAYEYDFNNKADFDEFVGEFFGYFDEIDGSNWRYPFEINEEIIAGVPQRTIDKLGVMRDFGSKNKAVVTMWNHARSAGSSHDALMLLLWTALAVAVCVGALFLAILIKRLLSHRVKLPKEEGDAQTPLQE